MKYLKHSLWAILLLLMWMPLGQTIFRLVETGGLNGAFVPHQRPHLTDSTWFEGSFQKEYESYFNDTLGFHQYFIRLRNQIDFSLYNKCHSYDIEKGKNGILIATTHLDAHLGRIHTRGSKIDSSVVMLRQLQDTLSKLNKTLVILLAPCKGAFCEQLAPYWYDTKKTHESDYERYVRLLTENKIGFIDFNKWFLDMKNTSKYPLFPKYGTHWSVYGGTLAADSIVKYIEKVRKIDLPDMNIGKIELRTNALWSDADLSSTLNLIWPLKNDTLAYPLVTYNKKNKAKIKSLFIGDSFFFTVGTYRMPDQVFEESSLWYYNNTIFTNGPNYGKGVGNIDLKQELNKHEVIGIMASDINLGDLGWGFIRSAWELYYDYRGSRIKYYLKEIEKDKAWYEKIVEKAKANNKSIERQMYEDAASVADRDIQKK